MSSLKHLIHIVGGGISGLICAIELEKEGYNPVIIEKENQVGGRLRTSQFNGQILDHGFQVLLTAYPAAKRYLNYDKLNLKEFLPGAVILKNGLNYSLGDPLRHFSFLNSTLSFPFANHHDFYLTAKLAARLRFKSVNKIFGSESKSSIQFLKEFGFTDDFIRHFFRPFLGGIFLENELNTSSRMLEFVLKMFIEGKAAIPAGGIQEIARQLVSRLKSTTFLMNTQVSDIEDGVIVLSDGRQLKSDFTIVASEPTLLIKGNKINPTNWRKCTNLYFNVNKSQFKKPILGLVADESALTNNLHFVNDTIPGQPNHLLSVTVVKNHALTMKELVQQVAGEITYYFPEGQLKFLKSFEIMKALPANTPFLYAPDPAQIQISERIFLTGDFLSNPSLNGAMESGRSTAEYIIKSMA